jgi:hypothetical protein
MVDGKRKWEMEDGKWVLPQSLTEFFVYSAIPLPALWQNYLLYLLF